MGSPIEIPPGGSCDACGHDSGREPLCERCRVVLALAAYNPDLLRSIARWVQPRHDRRRQRAIAVLERAIAADVEAVARVLQHPDLASTGPASGMRIRRGIRDTGT